MAKTRAMTERVDRAVYRKSGSYWTVKRNKWYGPYANQEEAREERNRLESLDLAETDDGTLRGKLRLIQRHSTAIARLAREVKEGRRKMKEEE